MKHPITPRPNYPKRTVALALALLGIWVIGSLGVSHAAVGGGGVFIPGGGVSRTEVTNIATFVANQVGGATNGILKLNGFGTNTTFLGQTNVGPVGIAAATNTDAALVIGNFKFTSDGDALSVLNLNTSAGVFGYNPAVDEFHIDEKLRVSETLYVTTGQDHHGLIVTGGGSNHFDGVLVVGSNVTARAYSSDNIVFTRMPTNTPSDGQVVTAAGTAGFTKWATGGGGSGDTNGVSYLLDGGGIGPAIRSILDGSDEILELLYPDGQSAGGITNDILELIAHDDRATGHIRLGTETFLGGSDVYLREGGRNAFRATGSNRSIYAGNGTDIAAEFTTMDQPIFGSYTFRLDLWEDGGFVVRRGTEIVTTNNMAFTSATVGTLTVTTNVIWPAGQLGPSSAVTNYIVDFATTNLQWIVATGHVHIVDFANITAGQTKYLSVTNPWSTNISVFFQTNIIWLGGTNGWLLGTGAMDTNRNYPTTNVVDFSFTALGTGDRNIHGFGVHASP